jgi:subtilase family serine protease
VNGLLKLAGPPILLLSLAACKGGGFSGVPVTGGEYPAGGHIPHWMATGAATAACPGSFVGQAQCAVLVKTGGVNEATPGGWKPADLEAAYDLPSSTKGKGQTIAIVDAYDSPTVASDLAYYRSYFKLPKARFTKYNQEGQKKNYPPLPPSSTDWDLEIDLDVDMVSASCPNCTIYLIEANSNSFSDLGAAEAEAVKLGAHIVSNSWYGTCAGACFVYDYETKGVTYLACAGDKGYGIGVPARFDRVVSVGGTDLSRQGSTFSEKVWIDTGAGCSTTTKPSWQHDSGCSGRTANDVSAVSGCCVAEYDTTHYTGWIEAYGTSVATPLIAGAFALAGNAAAQDGGKALWTLSRTQRGKDLHYISSGNDGSCNPTYLCTAGTNEYETYSGPGGWGTPKGIGAFEEPR